MFNQKGESGCGLFAIASTCAFLGWKYLIFLIQSELNETASDQSKKNRPR